MLTLACAGCSSAPPAASTSTTRATAVGSTTRPVSPFVPNRLQVDGTTLRRAGGARFVVKGVEVYAVPFYADGSSPDPALARVTESAWTDRAAMFARIAATGANTVRIEVSLASYRDDVYGLGGAGGYLERIAGFVEAANAAGLEVILTWGDALGEHGAILSDYRGQLAMMRTVATMLRDDPDVVYEPYNEPNGISWSSWLSLIETTISYWRTTIGYAGPLIVDTPGYSWDFDLTDAVAVVDYDAGILGRADLLVANHLYPNHVTCFCGTVAAAWMDAVGQYTRQVPLIGTEYGVYDGTGPEQLGWGRELLDDLASTSIPGGLNGAVAFVWAWVDPDSMTDLATGALTPWGEVVRSELLARDLAGTA